MPPVTDLQTMIDQTQEKLSEEATSGCSHMLWNHHSGFDFV